MHEAIIGVVTSGEHKIRAIQDALPEYPIKWIRPSEPVESELVADLPHIETRSALIATAKADHWSDAADHPSLSVVLFSDVVQYLPEIDYILERPKNYSHWLDQMMIQSGRIIHISAAYKAKSSDTSVHRPPPIVVEAVMRARLFKKPEIRLFAEEIGIERMMNAAGGLPVQLTPYLFDQTRPVAVYWKPDAFNGEEPTLITTIPWPEVTEGHLRYFATGAHPKPLRHLVNAVQ